MSFAAALLGSTDRAAARQAALAAVVRATQALVTLDLHAARSPARAPWLRLDSQVALAAALRAAGRAASLEGILSARLGASPLPPGHVALAELDARARAWGQLAQRKGPAPLRALVRALAGPRGDRDLLGLAARAGAAASRCATAAWDWDHGAGVAVRSAGPETPDLGDLALALPVALRRTGLLHQLVPSLGGRPRLLLGGRDPLERFTAWVEGLAGQAEEALARLRLLERHLATVDARLAGEARPAALRRCVAVSLGSWGIWAAELARLTGVELSSAWRTLGKAAELGLVAPVPMARRSRGDATLYAAPPWLQAAGLVAAPRGRPRAVPGPPVAGAGLAAALAEVDRQLAAFDRLGLPQG